MPKKRLIKVFITILYDTKNKKKKKKKKTKRKSQAQCGGWFCNLVLKWNDKIFWRGYQRMAQEKHNQMDKVKKCYRFWLKKKKCTKLRSYQIKKKNKIL